MLPSDRLGSGTAVFAYPQSSPLLRGKRSFQETRAPVTVVASKADAGTVASLFVFGCETATTLSEEKWATAKEASNSSIVIGRIRWFENDEEKISKGSMFGWSIKPRLRRLEDRAGIVTNLEGDGRFRWALPKGTYLIDRINYRDPWSGNYFIVPQVGFRLPENGRTYYAGTLKAEFQPKRDFLGGLSGGGRFSIEDQMDQEVELVREILDPTLGSVEKSLMAHDTRLPRSTDTTVEYNMAIQVLNMILMITP